MWGNNLKGPILRSLSGVYGLIVRCEVLVGQQLTIALGYTCPSPSVKTAALVHGQDYLAKRQFVKYRNTIRGEGQHLSDMTDVVLCVVVVQVQMEVSALPFQNTAKPKKKSY